jgi:hypothetical protein
MRPTIKPATTKVTAMGNQVVILDVPRSAVSTPIPV